MSLYARIAEYLQYFSPAFYKRRYFKKIDGISAENIHVRNVEPEMLWLKSYLKADATFIDIGCNVGSYIRLVENVLDPNNIYAFEPNKKLFLRLKRLFPKVHFSAIALSDENKTAQFKIPVIKGELKNSRGTLRSDYAENDEERFLTEEVRVETFDTWISNKKLSKIDFIKIDVEGNEMKTLRGAKKTIQALKPVLMVEMEQRHHKESLEVYIKEIKSWDYEAYYLDRKNLTLAKLTSTILTNQALATIEDKNLYINNFIFLPNSEKL